jgi:hypothetical protein
MEKVERLRNYPDTVLHPRFNYVDKPTIGLFSRQRVSLRRGGPAAAHCPVHVV